MAFVKASQVPSGKLKIKTRLMKKNEFWKFAIQTMISILSAIATALGVTSCMGHGPVVF